MKIIQITKGMKTIVDDEDYDLAMQYPWHATRSGSRWYARHTVVTDEHRWELWLHNLIMKPPEGMEVDHRNRDGLYNIRSNLRLCTRSQNLANRQSANASGYRGVDRKPNGTWRARIVCNSSLIYIGTYVTVEEAARAYDRKAKELFGEFATLNFQG